MTSVALLILTPFFLFIVGGLLGQPHAEVVASLSRPMPALVVAAFLVVGNASHALWHAGADRGLCGRSTRPQIGLIATTIPVLTRWPLPGSWL